MWLKYIVNSEVHFDGYLHIMDLINAQKMEHIKKIKTTSRNNSDV
jgi:hypothetical protein